MGADSTELVQGSLCASELGGASLLPSASRRPAGQRRNRATGQVRGLAGPEWTGNPLLYSLAPGGGAGSLPPAGGQAEPGPRELWAGWARLAAGWGLRGRGWCWGLPRPGPCSPPGQAAHLLGCLTTQTQGKHRPPGRVVLERLLKATTGVHFLGGALGPAMFCKK